MGSSNTNVTSAASIFLIVKYLWGMRSVINCHHWASCHSRYSSCFVGHKEIQVETHHFSDTRHWWLLILLCFWRSMEERAQTLWSELKTCLNFHWRYNYKPSSCLKCWMIFWNLPCKDNWDINWHGGRGALDMITNKKKKVSLKYHKIGLHSSCLCRVKLPKHLQIHFIILVHCFFISRKCWVFVNCGVVS